MSITNNNNTFTALLFCLLTTLLTACGHSEKHPVKQPSDIVGSRIGVQLGTTSDLRVSAYENDSSGTQVERFTKTADAIQALLQGKLDCIIEDELPAQAFVKQNPQLSILPQTFSTDRYAFCVGKENTRLLTQLNHALEQLDNSGALDTIMDRHVRQGLPVAYLPKNVARTNGTLVVATNATYKPYEYYDNGRVVGIDVDVMQAICDLLGMNLKMEDMNFDAVITSVQTGKAQVGASGLTVTAERKKNVLFTRPYSECRQVVIVLNEKQGLKGMSMMEKFKTDFLVDSHYMYLLQGLGNTLVITFFAIILSLLLGSFIAIVRATHDQQGKLPLLNALCQIYLTIIRGTPTMVQLLIIYYVVFAAADISKVAVAIVAFGLNSAAYLAEVVRSGIMSVPRGQMEAGRSLGLSYAKTMRLIILPQAYKNVMPAIGNELITLLKETSISGYIGLVDLTKGSDIIRSITYDALLPLGVVACIYLAIVMALQTGVNHMEHRLRKSERR